MNKWILQAMPLGIFALILSFPSRPASKDVRGQAQVLRVRVERFSPPISALEDAQTKIWDEEKPVTVASQAVKLQAGASAHNVLADLGRVRQQELAQRAWLAKVPMGGRIVVQAPQEKELRGLTIRQAAREATQELRVVGVHPSLQRDIQAEFIEGDITQLSLSRRAERLVEKELARANKASVAGAKIIESTQGSRILVASPLLSSADSAPTGVAPASTASKSAPTGENFTLGWAPEKETFSTSSIATEIRGEIEFRGGLAFVGDEEALSIFREEGGRAREGARVSIKEGRFEIRVKSSRGHLVGQLRDKKSGVLIGAGQIPIALNVDHKMVLSPVASGARVHVSSAYSYGKQALKVEGAKATIPSERAHLLAEEDGVHFSEEAIEGGSTFVLYAQAESHWGTLAVGVAGEETRMRLFPNRMMEALLNLTLGENKSLAARSGVIWGRVTKDGRPVAGARVELAGDQRIEPIYFNSLHLPDKFAEATSENGLFAFVWVTPGIQSVRVRVNNLTVPAQIIPAEAARVSYLEIEAGEVGSSSLDVYDSIDPAKEIHTTLRWAGDESSEIQVSGRGRLYFPQGPGRVTLEANAGDLYEMVRLNINRSSRSIHLPMVRRDWLETMASRKRINLAAGVGTIVGFMMENDFVVRIDQPKETQLRPDIVYFDSQGQALFTEEGVAGGGFIAFNVPPGLRTVSVLQKGDQRVYTQTLVAEPEITNLIKR